MAGRTRVTLFHHTDDGAQIKLRDWIVGDPACANKIIAPILLLGYEEKPATSLAFNISPEPEVTPAVTPKRKQWLT